MTDFTTYQCPPEWEFGWVTDPEYFEDTDDEITVTRRRYQLVDEAQVTWHPTTMLCRDCGGEGDLVAADGETLIPCERCDSDGRDPLAGTWTQEQAEKCWTCGGKRRLTAPNGYDYLCPACTPENVEEPT